MGPRIGISFLFIILSLQPHLQLPFTLNFEISPVSNPISTLNDCNYLDVPLMATIEGLLL